MNLRSVNESTEWLDEFRGDVRYHIVLHITFFIFFIVLLSNIEKSFLLFILDKIYIYV